MEKITINDYFPAYIAGDFAVKQGAWVVHLGEVEFITYRINEKNENQYLVMLHMKDKEAKIMVDSIGALKELLSTWAKSKDKELILEEEDLKGEVRTWD